MVQKRGTKAINKLCVREILGLSFTCGAYFFNFAAGIGTEAGKVRMRTAFFTRVKQH